MSRRLSFVLSTALLATAVAATPAHADTTITDLGGLPGAQSHWAASVNDAGVAVGVAFNGSGRDRAVRFDGNGTATQLAGPADASTTVNEVNNHGAAVGTTSGGSVGGTRAIRFKPDGTYAVLSVPFGFTTSTGLAITDSGTAYGLASDADRRQIPVRWRPDGVLMTMKMPEGATWAYVTRAAANGYVAGYVSGPGIPFLAVRWNPDGSVTKLARMADGAATTAQGVNQLGEVVGNANSANDQETFGVRWNLDGSLTSYGKDSLPKSINDRGVVVGSYYGGAEQHPFRWEKNGDKLELGRPDGVTNATALDINNDGVIVGRAGSSAVKWVVS
ncbi:hypothetical protein SAMN04488564_1021088 [Lentzea waywayandensis]|uniref:Extracellular repeat, HAF family n=1 Tax=Lentzea waywayandensis TaxID=84724 RepID=A0A1I6DN89_9PSEU|nr:hypothetical protein [Lentzea waywayandensis]SFR06827.1 hypothetical protein SAMN04488564_1021088 [Lentzea waywayandensis]